MFSFTYAWPEIFAKRLARILALTMIIVANDTKNVRITCQALTLVFTFPTTTQIQKDGSFDRQFSIAQISRLIVGLKF
jgi:hypothetical protein